MDLFLPLKILLARISPVTTNRLTNARLHYLQRYVLRYCTKTFPQEVSFNSHEILTKVQDSLLYTGTIVFEMHLSQPKLSVFL